MNLAQAIELCKNGHKEAFGTIVKEFSGQAVRFAWHFTGNKADAEDMAQETFLQVWKNLQSLQKQDSFKSWFFTILNNMCKKKCKSQKPTLELNEDTAIASRYAAESLEEIEANSVLAEYLKELSLIQRRALLLRDVEGLSYSEIAKILEVPEGTVKSRIASAREKMRSLMTGKEKGG